MHRVRTALAAPTAGPIAHPELLSGWPSGPLTHPLPTTVGAGPTGSECHGDSPARHYRPPAAHASTRTPRPTASEKAGPARHAAAACKRLDTPVPSETRGRSVTARPGSDTVRMRREPRCHGGLATGWEIPGSRPAMPDRARADGVDDPGGESLWQSHGLPRVGTGVPVTAPSAVANSVSDVLMGCRHWRPRRQRRYPSAYSGPVWRCRRRRAETRRTTSGRVDGQRSWVALWTGGRECVRVAGFRVTRPLPRHTMSLAFRDGFHVT